MYIDRHEQYPADLRVCRRALSVGSRSFLAASYLLPPRVRDAACALYAFCRLADDAIDEGSDQNSALADLHRRLDGLYAGRPHPAAADRILSVVVGTYHIPKALFEALLEGFFWDAQRRTYADIEGLKTYAARVAGSVGAMMALLMGRRGARELALACDLGIAMQLTKTRAPDGFTCR
jgi:phytoene synthase